MWLGPIIRNATRRDPNRPRQFPVQSLFAVIAVVALLPLIYLGVFSRYQADDYCFSKMIIEGGGYFGGLVEMYTKVSDRFSTMLVIGLLEPFGKLSLQILPGLLVVLFALGSYFLLGSIKRLFNLSISLIEQIALAAAFSFLCLYAAPDLFQSVLWMSGSVTYFLPLGLFLLASAWMLKLFSVYQHQKPPFWLLLVIILIYIIIGGFSETTAAMNLGILLLICSIILIKVSARLTKLSWSSIIGSAVVGTLIAMALMLVAPGNAYRVALMPEHPGFLQLVWLSIRYALGFVFQMLTSYPLPTIASLLIPFLFALQNNWIGKKPKSAGWLLWALPLFVLLVVICICAPSAYATSAYPENRALLSARMVMMAAIVAWGYLLGAIWKQYLETKAGTNTRTLISLTSVLLVFLGLYLMNGSLNILAKVPEYRQRAEAWDLRESQIKSMITAGEKDLVIKALDSNGRIREITGDPENWVNHCAAVHYGVDSFVAK